MCSFDQVRLTSVNKLVELTSFSFPTVGMRLTKRGRWVGLSLKLLTPKPLTIRICKARSVITRDNNVRS